MTVAQFFVYKRPIAWTALVATFVWGYFSYRAMPQRQDPVITVGVALVVTPYPGASAEKVEREVTVRVEKAVSENPYVEIVRSISQRELSLVFIELSEQERNEQVVWPDVEGKLRDIPDLPKVGDYQVRPAIHKDFGDTCAVMLTISSPPVSELEIDIRAESIRSALESFRRARPGPYRDNRRSAILVYPTTVARSYVLWIGRSLIARLAGRGIAEDAALVEAPSAGCVDFRLAPGKTEEDLGREVRAWEADTIGNGMAHPDVWPWLVVGDLGQLPEKLRRNPRYPAATMSRYSYGELREFADKIRDRLKRYATVGKVQQIGVQEEAIHLVYSGRRFAATDLHPAKLVGRLQQRNINLPGGRMESPGREMMIRPSGEFRSEREIGDVVLDSRNGFPVYLRDMADVVRGYQDPPGVMNLRTLKADGGDLQTTRAITLAIHQTRKAHIGQFDRDLRAALDSLRGTLPEDLKLERTSDEPAMVQHKVGQFIRNLAEAVVLVILVALLFMEWRSAVLVAFSIPLTIALTLGACQLLGVDLQQVSIAALIIALGLLVDDPVVAGDAINREMAAGVPRDVAAWLGPQKLARAIFYATVTNCAAFLPLLLVTGRTGEFIYALPVVVTASLVSSRIVSMTFMPLLGYYVLRGQKGFEAGLREGGRGATFARYYNGFSAWCLDHKIISLGVCLALLAGCTACFGRIGTAFFPKDLHSVFLVNVYLAEGSPIRQTRQEAMTLVDQIEALEGRKIHAYTAFVGAGAPRFWLSVIPEHRLDNYAQIMVHTADPRETSAMVERLKRTLPLRCTARVTIEQLETGPPIGVPVQVRILGDDPEQLRRLAHEAKQSMRAIPGTDNVHDDWDPEILQLAMQIQPDRANLAGVTNQDVALAVNAGFSGFAATTLREKDRVIPVTLRLRADERIRYEDLADLSVVSAATGQRVPLAQVADLDLELTAPRIGRRDYRRSITVKCDTVPGVLPSSVVSRMDKELREASAQWPPGYRYEFGGEKFEQEKGFRSLTHALIVSLLAIYLVLVWQFNSISKPLVVFAAVPFGLAFGLMGLVLTGAPLGFMAFLGIASLAGVIVSHIIVLFDYIEEMHDRGEELHRAVIDACLVRLRPVLVTVLATVGGLIPLVVEGGPLWEPMCYVQIVGLLAATLVTKIVVPVIYVMFVEDLGIIAWQPANARAEGPPPEWAGKP
jgi:multidrug efflux pump subunit AcrB